VAFQRKRPEKIGALRHRFRASSSPPLRHVSSAYRKVRVGVHEIKFDGYRVQVHIANNEVQIFTRRCHDCTKRFRKVAEDAWHVNAGSAIIDGELVVPSGDGDFRRAPLMSRKAELKNIVAGSSIQFSDSFTVGGREMFKHACRIGVEGVVSKVADGPYLSGRSRDWVKVTCAQRETLPIASFALDGDKWDGLYLGRSRGRTLSTRAKSTMASTRPRPLNCAGD
jgi:bifunctional non-homologous end joining protein LigD